MDLFVSTFKLAHAFSRAFIPAVSAVSILFFQSLTVLALPPDAGRQFEQQRQLESERKLPPAQMPEVEEPQPVEDSVTSTVSFYVDEFLFDGEITLFDQETLQQAVEEYTQRTLTLTELKAAAAAVTRLYHDHGYFVAQAVLPPQDVTEGTVTIRVIEGELEDVEINDPQSSLRLSTDSARKILLHAIPLQEPVNKYDLERGGLLLSDLPGMSASLHLEAGEAPETTRLVADLAEGPWFNPWLQVDNFGDRLTGYAQGTAAADLNNLSGRGDQVGFYVNHSLEGDSTYLSADYEMPVGFSGLKAGGGYRFLDYELGKEFSNSDAKGETRNWFLFARYPIQRSRQQNLYLSTEFDWKALEDELLGEQISDQELWRLALTLSGSRATSSGNGWTQGSLSLYQGELDLSNLPASAEFDQSPGGPGAEGGFTKLRGALSHTHRFSDRVFVVASTQGQYAPDNLASTEKFQLGGLGGVRAYPSGEATGDNGALVSLEGYWLAGVSRFAVIRLLAFYDGGWIQQFQDDSNLALATSNTYDLHGIGGGVEMSRGDRWQLNLLAAHQLGNNAGEDPVTGNNSDGSDDDYRFWVSLRVDI